MYWIIAIVIVIIIIAVLKDAFEAVIDFIGSGLEAVGSALGSGLETVGSIFESIFGKIFLGAGIVGIGFLVINKITEYAIFISLAKACAIVMVVSVVLSILINIFSK